VVRTTVGIEAESCTKPSGVQRLLFSASKHRNIRRHFHGALRRDRPVRGGNRPGGIRPGADERRDGRLDDVPARDGFNRYEYPPR
jgi:hypothetical protein